MSLNYDSDDVFQRSPGLVPVRPKATPSPSPPPIITQQITVSSAQPVSSPSSRRPKKSNRLKAQPSQGDFVLLRAMDPNREDIARQVVKRALNSDSGSEADEDDMEEPSPVTEMSASEHTQALPAKAGTPPTNLQEMARKALGTSVNSAASNVTKFPHRDSVVEMDSQPRGILDANAPTSQASSTGPLTNGIRLSTNGIDSRFRANSYSTLDATSNLNKERRSSVTNGRPHDESIATSPNLRELTIPESRGPPGEKLPALQTPQSPSRDGTAVSPNQGPLPSFRHLSELAETAINEQETNRTNGYPHRQSISSTGQSPISGTRQLSISSARSPGSTFPPINTTSPISASSDIQTRDPFLRSGQHLSLFSARRPSQASENGPYSATIHSASTTTNDSYQSSDGLSPGTQPAPIEARTPRMSIDSAMATRTLPPPLPQGIQHIPAQGAGGFKCDHPGCNAPPFQTQYLLNSHANVHSQSRPHYCPVAGCPRGEGGKGFKRKNEMIRHGLVHASPGYVCPFCPDREHKYPRPDNLQRHVRVHHVDKDKDDPQLREVLAQRPEGGSRGRRRRVSS